ncbi:MAG TPA: 3-isopropylmalate dehydrogenase [Candidatus Mediterraneibacter norfolkensis]|nr:3-isopropylmalate dehydrogenase [Candidatus Mediterraneibacter norfolkensis]
MQKKKIQWHQGFSAALRITLQEEMEFLEMQEEYLLSRKPLQIDILILKKKKELTIRKAIGRIFRRYNIIEYKSPEDYLTINDFYKVYAYACVYQSNTDRINEVDPRELTITFVCSHFPREMVRHLEEVRGIHINLAGKGIYYLKGDPIPIQLLITPELSREESYWMQNLRTDLKAGGEIRELMMRYEQNRKRKDYEAVMDLITRANWEQMEEEKKMCDALNELFAEELKEADERGRAAGMESGLKAGKESGRTEGIQLAKQVFRLSRSGVSESEIARQCGITVEQVKEILE